MNSVCMATYNGEKYLHEQIKSILSQLSDNDELLILDDCSTDATWSIINSFKDFRIKIYRNGTNMGVNKTFEKLIYYAQGDFLFLSDQDDIWVPNRMLAMLEELKFDELVSSNFDFIDSSGMGFQISNFLKLKKVNSKKSFANLSGIFFGTANYYGCAMAFRKSLKDVILPIPTYVESHDLWIAMAANFRQSISHLEDVTLLRRIHGGNVSVVNRSLLQKIFSRLIFSMCFCSLLFRVTIRKIK